MECNNIYYAVDIDGEVSVKSPNKPLKEIRNAMRNELKLWKQRIQAEDEL